MKRTPKNYDGIEPVAKTIRKLLPEVLGKLSPLKQGVSLDLLQAWPDVVGEKFAPFTRAVSFIDGVYTVIVKSSTLYNVLSLYEKPHLLRKLQERSKQEVRNIVFRMG